MRFKWRKSNKDYEIDWRYTRSCISMLKENFDEYSTTEGVLSLHSKHNTMHEDSESGILI